MQNLRIVFLRSDPAISRKIGFAGIVRNPALIHAAQRPPSLTKNPLCFRSQSSVRNHLEPLPSTSTRLRDTVSLERSEPDHGLCAKPLHHLGVLEHDVSLSRMDHSIGGELSQTIEEILSSFISCLCRQPGVQRFAVARGTGR